MTLSDFFAIFRRVCDNKTVFFFDQKNCPFYISGNVKNRLFFEAGFKQTHIKIEYKAKIRMDQLYQNLKQFGQVKINEPLSKHTTFKIGGTADYFLIVERTSSLVSALQFLDGAGQEYFILGGGSNMLVRDQGFRGVAVQVRTKELNITDSGIVCDAGCTTVEVARKSIQANFVGFEWGVGVPGTIGGAVRGNAGAMNEETKDCVEKVEVYENGEMVEYTNAECEFSYRSSRFKHKGGVVLRVWLALQKAEPGVSAQGMKKALEYLQYRNKTQPQGFSSTGCVFKNVEVKDILVTAGPEEKERLLSLGVPEEFFTKGKISAGWLVEHAGMKGAQVGQAKVSEVHGNFVVNMGQAHAQDVLNLVEEIKEKVYDRFHLKIEEEMQII